MAKIEELLKKIISSKIESLGYKLYDVQYVKEGKEYYLRVLIDSEKGIDLNDCEKVSNEINPILDEADYIKDTYFLEVSSPGIERILRKDEHLKYATGKEIEIKLFKPINGNKEVSGILKTYNENQIIIKQNNNREKSSGLTIERKNISLMKLKYNWN